MMTKLTEEKRKIWAYGVSPNSLSTGKDQGVEEMNSIDREVAEKVMRWSVGPMPGKLTGDDVEWCWYDKKGPKRFFDWSPSTRIVHAWEVVEKMVAMHEDGDFHLEHLYNYWRVGFCHRETWFEDAPTAPLAICKAALQAIGETK